MRNPGKNLLAAFLLAAVCPYGVMAKSLYDDSLEKYRSGLFREAANGFSAAAVQEPAKQLYHYLLANCLVHLEKHSRAAEEYRVAYMLDPASSTGEFCRQALIAYKKPVPQTAASQSLHPDVSDTTELARVKSLIRKQANFEKDKHDSLATRSELSIQSQVDDELRRIDQWMQNEIQKLSDPLVYNPGPRANPLLANPDLLKQKEDQIRATAQAERERVKKAASERSQVYESWRKDRGALLDEAAGNLETQLDQPMGRSGVKLQAHGTGLYVRYYGKGGANYLPDPHQATVRIKDAGDPEAAAAETETQTTQKPQTDAGSAREVKGKVMKEPQKAGSINVQIPIL